MVFKDEVYKSKQSPDSKFYYFKNKLKTCSLLDRVGSFIIDYFVILFPIATLLTATVQRDLKINTILQNDSRLYLVYFQYVLLFFTISFFYNFITTYYFSSTFGQKFFNLKVGSIERKNSIGFYESFVRSLVFTGSVFCLGLPFLNYFTHKGRRTVHDLVSDTYVYSQKSKATVLRPSNVLLWRYFSVFGFLILFAGLLSVSKSALLLQSESTGYEENETLAGCEKVEEMISSWPEPLDGRPQRLEMAMSLYAIEEVGADCLKQETDLVFDSGEENNLSYLALSFVYSDQSTRSDRYLDKVCESDSESESCKMAKVIEFWSDDKKEEVELIFDSMDETSTYFKLWQVRFFMTENKVKQAWNVLRELPKVKSIASFSSFSKAKALWQMGQKEQSRLVADTIYERENKAEIQRLANWQCFEELDNSCGASAITSCQKMKANLKETNNLADITTFKSMLCNNSLSVTAKYSWEPDVQKLISLNFKTLDAPRLNTFLKNDFSDWRVPYIAITEYLKNVTYVEFDLFKNLVDWTVTIPESFEKKKLIGKVFDFFYEKQEYELASAYGETYFTDDITEEQTKAMVVSAFKSGAKEKADGYLESLNNKAGVSRGLASESAFEKIKKQMGRGK